ncbi:MAG: DNA primase [Chloroflexi bacterium]|nr:DNA primase [Chloroflexota bacterium]
MSAIDEVKQKTDIVELIGQYTTLKKAGRNLNALCPFHSEKSPSFFVYPEQQSWHCFGACSTGGDAFSFLMKKEGLDFGEALRQLAQRAGVALPTRVERDTQRDANDRLHQINEAAALYFHNLLLNSPAAEKARSYLAGRGLNQKAITDFQLGYALNSWEALKPYLLEKGFKESEMVEAGLLVSTEDGKTHDRFRNKIIFPIWESRGRVTGFGARVLDDSLPKYVNSPQTPLFDKSGTLYGINLASPAIRQQNLAVIVEGYMDVIAAHQYGLNNVVASMGTAITDKQITLLKKLTKNILLVLDPDAAGEEAMLRCIQYEDKFDIEMRFVILPAGKDPDDIIKEDVQTWQKFITDALPVVDYTANIDKEHAIDRLIPLIAGTQDGLRRHRYLMQLEKVTKIRYAKLESTVEAFRSRQTIRKPNVKPTARTSKTIVSSPLEEECLALLLQHPELKKINVELLPDYFEGSANREIFSAWCQVGEPDSLRDKLDTALHDFLDALLNRPVLATRIEERYNRYVLRLREEFLRNLERKRAAVFALEAELKGSGADLDKLKEEGIEVSAGLREVFTRQSRGGRPGPQKNPSG